MEFDPVLRIHSGSVSRTCCLGDEISCLVLLLELYWCLAAEVAVPAVGVEPFDLLEDRTQRLNSSTPAPTLQQFNLHAFPERLDKGVVLQVGIGAQ